MKNSNFSKLSLNFSTLRLLTVVTLGSLLALSSCAPSSSQHLESTVSDENSQGIVAGQPVTARDPAAFSTVALYLQPLPSSTRLTHFCSGTLIAPRIVLTAAHCIIEVQKEARLDRAQTITSFKVGFGLKKISDLRDPAVRLIGISDFKSHDQYTSEAIDSAAVEPFYDIALLELAEAAPRPFQPVPLLLNERLLRKGTQVVLAGFGLTDGFRGTEAARMNQAQVTIDNPDFNSVQFSYLAQQGRSACQGDSGGPAYLQVGTRTVVVGVTSFGDRFCSQLGVYTSVPKMAHWIRAEVRTLLSNN